MEDLLNSRKETMEVRKETGAMDLKPGEVQGLRADSGAGTSAGGKQLSAAMAKRKKELEDRRSMIQAKRRKLVGNGVDAEASLDTPAPSNGAKRATVSHSSTLAQDQGGQETKDPFAASEASSNHSDPFAAVERNATRPVKSRWDKRPAPDVDSFLADVEKELASKDSR